MTIAVDFGRKATKLTKIVPVDQIMQYGDYDLLVA